MSRVDQPGQYPLAFETTITKSAQCKYLLSLPEGYENEKKEWPMILFLHGAGERGDDLDKVKVHDPPKLIEKGESLPFIVVSPQCPEGKWWDVETLTVLLDEITANYRVDEDRLYLTGLSMGGFGTFSLASEHPERFAAIAPVCGGGNRLMQWTLKGMPAWVFHGGKDTVVLPSESERMVEMFKKQGNEVRFTVYPDAGHDSWTETYNNPELYEWFLAHRSSDRK